MAVHTLQASILLLCILASDPLSAAPHSPNVEKTQNQGVSKSGARVIAFRSETVDPSVALSLSALRSAASRRDGDRGKLEELEARPEQVVVQMRGGKCSDRALRDALGSGASHVLSHISPCSFVAMCDSVKTALRLEAHANVVWVGPMLPEYKTAPELSASARVSTAAASRRKNAPATDPAHAAPRVALDVMVVAPMEQRLLARWAAALSEAVAGEGGEAGGGGVSVARGAKREVVVECLAGDAGRVAHWLARKAEVLWVQGGATSAQGGATSDVALNASGLAMRGMDGAGEV
ncbi:hypothetical protein T484DRAFT_1914338 [Baffinella frigidus]|nr:hypothetical protein T484DRAFT_1914338 [Cryptophyta sp. CCMP2293]